MKKCITLMMILSGCLFTGAFSQQVAFPGAEGFGKYATGGRTGSVYHVTNLNDSGEGSFRDAVSEPNRIIIFDVGGVIKISSTLIVDSNLYIAGQTAPGEGITVYGDRLTFSNANNAICRYIRFRMGVIGSSGKDACGLAHGGNMIFDHVSVSWGRDETFSINWDKKGAEPNKITIQNSIISQGLLTHSAGGLIQTNGGVTLYRNLYVDNSTRNNKVKGVNQYVNNIVYNWKDAAYIMGGDSEGESFVNVESNYFIKGPDNGSTPISDGNELFHIYAVDNWYDSSLDATLNGYEIPFDQYSGGPDFQNDPYNYPTLPTVSASNLYNDLIPTVGASLPYRDYVDFYVINEVKSLGKDGTLISDERLLPFGAPSDWVLWGGTPRTDTDGDGMPDDWEDYNGTDKTIDDAMTIAPNSYTNIENYINGITKDDSQEYLRAPLNFAAKSYSQASITFTWLDYTDNEEGFILERYVNGAFVPVDTSVAESDSLTLTGLQPDETDTFRIYAFKGAMKSDPTDSIMAKSLPVVRIPIDPDSFVPDMEWSGAANNNWDKITENWLNGPASITFNDNAKVLFGGSLTGDQSIHVAENVVIGDMFVKSDYNYAFSGPGLISGIGSVNKTGSGDLTLGTENTYTGQTVIWDGTLNVATLADGGSPSSIGASSDYYFNVVFKGGKLNYTGATASTDRSMQLDETGELSVADTNATLTMSTGTFTGAGGLIKSGKGTLKLLNGTGNDYKGETTIADGVVSIDLNTLTSLNNVLGCSGIVNLTGGTLQMINGQTSNYEEYNLVLNIPEGSSGGFIPFRNCYMKCKVTGGGTLRYTIPYVREYIQGNWDEFTGTLNAFGEGTSEGSQLLLNNGAGLPKARIYTSGNTKIVCWKNAGTMYIGGLSGDAGTSLAGADKKNNASTMTWIVGGANTNETFYGIINNECSSASYKGTTSIIKEGTGIWRLAGDNIYSGTTSVTGGALIVNGTHSGKGSVTVQQGARLAGKGILPGIVEVQANAVIEPGDSDIDTITMGTLKLHSGSIINIDIDKNTGINDVIHATDTLYVAGTLNLNITGTLVAGDEFTIFFADSLMDGPIDSIIPSVPGDELKWGFSGGVLTVLEDPNPVSRIGNLNGQEPVVTIVPNPVTTGCIVKLPGSYAHIDAKVISASGSVVATKKIDNCSQLQIDFSGQPKGIYYIIVRASGQQIAMKKIIRE